MAQYCFVIINNAGHSWSVLNSTDASAPKDQGVPVLPQLLQEGWIPVRETPMGGGTSSLAHSLVLLEKSKPIPKTKRGAKS
jgi:hypothetical protein